MSEAPSPTAPVTVIDHPLIRVRLTRLRDASLGHEAFRTNLHEIAELMMFPVCRELETRSIGVETPLQVAQGDEYARPLILVPILRAGLGMLRGILHILPEARIGHIGMFRNEETLQPETYYCKLPPDLPEADVLLIDPMLATGNSSAAAADQLKAEGARRLLFLSLISAPEGIAHFQEQHPDVPIFTGAIDEGLNEKGFIVPGLGDAGDRYFGTV